jgi:hypothetical protein
LRRVAIRPIARQYGVHASFEEARARPAVGAGTAIGPLKLRCATADAGIIVI